jgi:adenylate kinase
MGLVIFVGGLSGVGKTTVIESARQAQPNIRHVMAGELIRRGTVRSSDKSYVRPTVENSHMADFFQEILIKEFLLEIKSIDAPIVLDGHFVVPAVTGPNAVPASVFLRLGIQRLFLLLGPPKEIATRLKSRPVPSSWWDGEAESLERFQKIEEQHALAVERETGIPLLVEHESLALKNRILQTLGPPDSR